MGFNQYLTDTNRSLPIYIIDLYVFFYVFLFLIDFDKKLFIIKAALREISFAWRGCYFVETDRGCYFVKKNVFFYYIFIFLSVFLMYHKGHVNLSNDIVFTMK